MLDDDFFASFIHEANTRMFEVELETACEEIFSLETEEYEEEDDFVLEKLGSFEEEGDKVSQENNDVLKEIEELGLSFEEKGEPKLEELDANEVFLF